MVALSHVAVLIPSAVQIDACKLLGRVTTRN
ncbi:hypothetical protein BH24ACT5_BH24ACT5_00290 [soil metagenome]